ncbi:MAG: glycoside hydrolase family 18 protein [Terracidiphilus sp.]
MFRYLSILIGIAVALPSPGFGAARNPGKPEVTGYVFARGNALTPGQVDAKYLTRINYAFANIKDGRIVLDAPADAQNLAQLTALRNTNPRLTVLVSVGGWLWSKNFSDIAVTSASRRLFDDSVMGFLAQYDLDGLDIDWEYPGLPGAGHPYRAEDKQNFTALLKELRSRFDAETRRTGRQLYLTVAMGAGDDVVAHTEMRKVARYVDTVNLMTYDYYEAGSDPTTGHHAPLFANPADPKKASSDETVRDYEKAGVPAEKILLGVPFYGRAWGEVANQNHGLFQQGKTVAGFNGQYSAIAANLLGQGFTRYWDDAAQAPYLYNAEKHIFVSYEDPESLAAKCKYVRVHKLGGVMFWEYFGDPEQKLLETIDEGLGGEGAKF